MVQKHAVIYDDFARYHTQLSVSLTNQPSNAASARLFIQSQSHAIVIECLCFKSIQREPPHPPIYLFILYIEAVDAIGQIFA
jgi:hypothetical protein